MLEGKQFPVGRDSGVDGIESESRQGPRLGAAFSLNRATVLRGGFDISYVH
jgi:hypothetical protein